MSGPNRIFGASSLACGGPLPLDAALDVAAQVATALDEAHRHGIVHRDVKPENIMITARGQVKVLDFGLAKRANDAPRYDAESILTIPGFLVGTLPYMSPEQVRGEEMGDRSDIFSLAVCCPKCSPASGSNVGQVENVDPNRSAEFSEGNLLVWLLLRNRSKRPEVLEKQSGLTELQEIEGTMRTREATMTLLSRHRSDGSWVLVSEP